jgi:hypothetical protein
MKRSKIHIHEQKGKDPKGKGRRNNYKFTTRYLLKRFATS